MAESEVQIDIDVESCTDIQALEALAYRQIILLGDKQREAAAIGNNIKTVEQRIEKLQAAEAEEPAKQEEPPKRAIKKGKIGDVPAGEDRFA